VHVENTEAYAKPLTLIVGARFIVASLPSRSSNITDSVQSVL